MDKYKVLMRSIRQYKLPSILTMVFVIGEVLMEVLIPYIMAKLIDTGITPGNMKNIISFGIILVIFAIGGMACGILSGMQASVASCGFAANLRKDMYYAVQKYSFSNIDKFSTAGIVTRMTTDITNVQNAYQMIIRIAVRCPIMLISALIFSLTISVKLSMIYVITIPILFVILIGIIKKVHPTFVKVFETYDDLNQVVQEDLDGIRVVKSYTREFFEIGKFKNISKKIYELFIKAEKMVIMNAPIMMISIYTALILLSFFGAKMIVASGNTPGVVGGLTTGQLTSMFTYTMQILMSLMFISMIFVMITISQASMQRIADIITEESDIQEKEAAVDTVKDGSIRFENVQFVYGESTGKNVLSDIDIEIKSGETIGIIGGTGSSKSSLVQLIPRLYDVKEGSVKVGGVDVRDYKLDSLRNEVAMVLQKNVLFSGTIKENLRWGDAEATDEDIVRVCKLACADEFIQEFPDKYDTYIEQGGTNVSGGQRQRLCIARALLKKPKILILDDSTSAVDTKTDSLIRKAFIEEIPDTTKIIIAQRISSVQDADRIIVMDDGCVKAFASHEELLKTNEIYREVYESQVKGGEEDA